MIYKISAGVLILLLFVALAAPWLKTSDPSAMNLPQAFAKPSRIHFFGADQNGSDVYSQVLYGARTSLVISFATVFLSMLIGLIVASITTYRGGWSDLLLARTLDMIQAFPGFLLALALVATLGASARNLIFAMTITSWATYARLVRGEVLHMKEREYIKGAEAAGASPARILVRHMWPHLAPLLIVQATFGLAGVILVESGLSFLGLGVSSEVPTWGALLNDGRRFLVEAPHISLFPGLTLSILVLCIQLSGEGLRRWLNPRERRDEIRS